MKKTKFSEKTPLRKSVEPIVIFLILAIVAYGAYKAYVAIQNGMKSVFPVSWNGVNRSRSAQESLQKKGFTMKDGVAHVKVKGMDDSRYLDQTQA